MWKEEQQQQAKIGLHFLSSHVQSVQRNSIQFWLTRAGDDDKGGTAGKRRRRRRRRMRVVV